MTKREGIGGNASALMKMALQNAVRRHSHDSAMYRGAWVFHEGDFPRIVYIDKSNETVIRRIEPGDKIFDLSVKSWHTVPKGWVGFGFAEENQNLRIESMIKFGDVLDLR